MLTVNKIVLQLLFFYAYSYYWIFEFSLSYYYNPALFHLQNILL